MRDKARKTRKTRKTFTIRLTDETKQLLGSIARQEERPQGAVVESALRVYAKVHTTN